MEDKLSYIERLKMINEVKNYFEKRLEYNLNLIKVQSPLFVKANSGLQDDLTGVEKAITFEKNSEIFEIVHSLAKWKRDALGRYNFPVYNGIYTNMKAIRKDEEIDNIHSLFVEQWDWEKVIAREDRNIDYLIKTVKEIYLSLKETNNYINKIYPFFGLVLPDKLTFITSQALEDKYPYLLPKEREYLIAKENGAAFIIGIGDKLKSGIAHDLRSPDYDDWKLNGDLLIYDPAIEHEIEITSMGIRVDKNALIDQLKKANCFERINLPYHQNIINNNLPYTIGGGIGTSRVLMLLLQAKHIAEVQASSWDDINLNKIKTLKKL